MVFFVTSFKMLNYFVVAFILFSIHSYVTLIPWMYKNLKLSTLQNIKIEYQIERAALV